MPFNGLWTTRLNDTKCGGSYEVSWNFLMCTTTPWLRMLLLLRIHRLWSCCLWLYVTTYTWNTWIKKISFLKSPLDNELLVRFPAGFEQPTGDTFARLHPSMASSMRFLTGMLYNIYVWRLLTRTCLGRWLILASTTKPAMEISSSWCCMLTTVLVPIWTNVFSINKCITSGMSLPPTPS